MLQEELQRLVLGHTGASELACRDVYSDKILPVHSSSSKLRSATGAIDADGAEAQDMRELITQYVSLNMTTAQIEQRLMKLKRATPRHTVRNSPMNCARNTLVDALARTCNFLVAPQKW